MLGPEGAEGALFFGCIILWVAWAICEAVYIHALRPLWNKLFRPLWNKLFPPPEPEPELTGLEWMREFIATHPVGGTYKGKTEAERIRIRHEHQEYRRHGR